MSRLKKLIFGETPYVKVEDKNRFYYMLQQMQANRWKITMIVLFLFFFIIAGINSAVFFGVSIEENWKEMLLILFGAFVGNLNKVVDYWFNSEDRDKMLIQKVDEEDGSTLSNVSEYPTTPRPPQPPVVVVTQVKEETPVVVEEPVVYEEPTIYTEPEVYEEPIVEEYPTEEPTQEGEENI
jgi:hypothetical protein